MPVKENRPLTSHGQRHSTKPQTHWQPRQGERPHLPTPQDISITGPCSLVSGNLVNEVRHCCTASDIQSYYQTRHKWSTFSVDSLDSIGLKVAISSLCPNLARSYQKLCCGWLPVNYRESRVDPDHPPSCSACSPTKFIPKTVDHVFQCTSFTRRQLVSSRLATLPIKFSALGTANCITAISVGAQAWAEGRNIPPVNTLNLPDTAAGRLSTLAYDKQSTLSWNIFFKGFWSASWHLAQEAHLRADPGQKITDTSARWSGKTQLWCISLFVSVWGLRCADEHGANPKTELLICSSRCERAIRCLYNKGSKFPHHEST